MRLTSMALLLVAQSQALAWYQGDVGGTCVEAALAPQTYSTRYRCTEDIEASIPEVGVVILDCQQGPDGRRLDRPREVIFAASQTWCTLYAEGAAALESGAIIVGD